MESDTTSSATFYRFLAWFETNTKQVLVGTGLAILVGIIVWFFIWRQGEKQKEAGGALSAAFVPQATGEARSQSADGFLKVASQYSGSQAGAQALLLGAAALFEQGKYSDARQQFEKFTREHRGNPFMPQAFLGIAASLDAESKTSEAVTSYKSLIDRYPTEAATLQAKFSLARIYQTQNKAEDAFRLYEDIARSDSFGQLGSESSVRAEELKTKYPELAPPPVAPAPITSLTNVVTLKTNQ